MLPATGGGGFKPAPALQHRAAAFGGGAQSVLRLPLGILHHDREHCRGTRGPRLDTWQGGGKAHVKTREEQGGRVYDLTTRVRGGG